MAKAPTKRKAPAKKPAAKRTDPLKAAKARVAKLEAKATRQAAIASAKKQIDAGKAALAKARKAK